VAARADAQHSAAEADAKLEAGRLPEDDRSLVDGHYGTPSQYVPDPHDLSAIYGRVPAISRHQYRRDPRYRVAQPGRK